MARHLSIVLLAGLAMLAVSVHARGSSLQPTQRQSVSDSTVKPEPKAAPVVDTQATTQQQGSQVDSKPESNKSVPKTEPSASIKPEANKPEANKPEANKPEANKPEANKPEANKPETNKPETNQLKANQPKQESSPKTTPALLPAATPVEESHAKKVGTDLYDRPVIGMHCDRIADFCTEHAEQVCTTRHTCLKRDGLVRSCKKECLLWGKRPITQCKDNVSKKVCKTRGAKEVPTHKCVEWEEVSISGAQPRECVEFQQVPCKINPQHCRVEDGHLKCERCKLVDKKLQCDGFDMCKNCTKYAAPKHGLTAHTKKCKTVHTVMKKPCLEWQTQVGKSCVKTRPGSKVAGGADKQELYCKQRAEKRTCTQTVKCLKRAEVKKCKQACKAGKLEERWRCLRQDLKSNKALHHAAAKLGPAPPDGTPQAKEYYGKACATAFHECLASGKSTPKCYVDRQVATMCDKAKIHMDTPSGKCKYIGYKARWSCVPDAHGNVSDECKQLREQAKQCGEPTESPNSKKAVEAKQKMDECKQKIAECVKTKSTEECTKLHAKECPVTVKEEFPPGTAQKVALSQQSL